MNCKAAAGIAQQNALQHIDLQRLTEYHFPVAFMESGTAVTEIFIDLFPAQDGFPRPGAVTVVIALAGFIRFLKISLGHIGDF